ncbi:hypothetical protein [Streptomyces sp. NBC_00454]
MATSLLDGGSMLGHANLSGDGEPPLHPAVGTFSDTLPTARREPG